MTKSYRAYFNYVGEKAKDYSCIYKVYLEAFYVPIYNAFCTIVNSEIDKWNSEYDEKNNGSYEKYIQNQEQNIVDLYINNIIGTIRDKTASISNIEKFYINEELVFCMKMKDDVVINFYLIEELA